MTPLSTLLNVLAWANLVANVMELFDDEGSVE